VLALAAACSVLEMGDSVHEWDVFAFSFLGCFCFCFWFLSSGLLPDDRFGSGSNSPDETK